MGWNGSDQVVKAKDVRPRAATGKLVPFAGLAALVVACGLVVWWWTGLDAGTAPKALDVSARTIGSVQAAKPFSAKSMKTGSRVKKAVAAEERARRKANFRARIDVDGFEHLEGKDKTRAKAVQEAVDKGDLEETRKTAVEALSSENPTVRLAAVEALGVFGEETLSELTTSLCDPDENVREAAANAWELGVQNVEDPQDRFDATLLVLRTVKDFDQLLSLEGILNAAATDMIDGEEDEKVAANNRLKVVQALADIIETGASENVLIAKEAYADVTGNDWAGVDEADIYLQDPENYESPGERAEAARAEEEAQIESQSPEDVP